jgi:hypothetical protein
MAEFTAPCPPREGDISRRSVQQGAVALGGLGTGRAAGAMPRMPPSQSTTRAK